MATATAPRRPSSTPAAPPKLAHGEIVTWTVAGQVFPHATVTAALDACGLDKSIVREIIPRNAFARASKTLADERIIEIFEESADSIDFQFTARKAGSQKIEYQFETMLKLNKHTGDIACPIAELATKAKTELDRCMSERTPGDITTIVQRLFERAADLFRIRDQGGAYFVPQQHVAFVDKVEAFLVGKLQGTMRRYMIAAGNPATDKSVKHTVQEGLAEMIREHERAVQEFGIDTRESTLTKAVEKVKMTGIKIEAYAAYLQEEKGRLEKSLEKARGSMIEKINALAACRDADFQCECEHCGHPQAVPDPKGKKAIQVTCSKCGKEFSCEFDQ